MAFPSEAVKEEARRRIQQGDKKPKDIAEALGCTAQDVSNLKYTMGNSSNGKHPVKKVKPAKASSDGSPVVKLLSDEEKKLRTRRTQLEDVLEVYAEKGKAFTNAIEEEIDRLDKRLDVLEPLIKGYNED